LEQLPSEIGEIMIYYLTLCQA